MVVTKVDGVSGDWDGEGKMKKGTWTAEEDAVLLEYVRSHGEGNWNAVRKNSGLRRCGKSCRLRWANHLRPNLKKGSFSPEEERIVVELHARFGNKWARMASMLPGRTDNEIKNYWNTRMKKRRRQRLPLYSDQHQHVHPFISAPTTPTTTEAVPIPLPFQSYNFHQNPQPNSSFSPSNNSTTFSFQCPTTPILSHPVTFKRFRRSGSDSLLPPLSTDVPPTTSCEYNALHIPRNQHPLGHTAFPRFPLSSSSCQLSDPGLGHCEFKEGPNRFLPTPSLPPKAPSLPLLDINTMGFDVNAELSNARKRSRASTNPNSSFVVDHDGDELLEDLLAESCHDENVRLQQQLLHPLPLGPNNVGYWGTSPPMVSQLEGMHGIQNNNEASHMHLPYQGSEEAMGNTNNQENMDSFQFNEISRDDINSTDGGDLSKLMSFFPTSLEIPEWFSCSTSGDTSKAQSSPDEPVYVMGFDRTQQPSTESWNDLPEFC